MNDWKSNFTEENGLFYGEEVQSKFEELYLQIREKENRLLEDQLVVQLPYLPSNHVLAAEWKRRLPTLERFVNYLKTSPFKRVLEIGCGNGWFSNQVKMHVKEVVAQDINEQELKQASRVFQDPNLTFVLTDDVLRLAESYNPDLIVFNASLQYFDPQKNILNELKSILTDVEIHVLDSPIYANKKESEAAKLRSDLYYEKMNTKELSNYYFHWTEEDISEVEFLWRPSLWTKYVKKDSPFSWVKK